MLGKFSSLICDSSKEIQDLVRDSWSLHCRTCLGRASDGRVAIESKKESFLVVMKSHVESLACETICDRGQKIMESELCKCNVG